MANTSKLSKINEPVLTLKQIQKVAPDAIIAGGYFRDRFNEVPFHDIDIYLKQPTRTITDSRVDDIEFWKNFLKLKVNVDYISDLGETDEEYDMEHNHNIVTIFEITKNGLQYNLILLDTSPVDYVIEKFDFNICKTYCDGKKIVYTKQFMSDIEHKTISFSSSKTSTANFTHAMHVHLPKLQQKYPTHKLMVPEIHRERYQQYKRQFA